MDRNEIIEIARSHMVNLKPMETREKGYVFHHGLRTAGIAMKLVDLVDPSPVVDRDILFAAAVFHDIGKGSDPHNEIGAAMAGEVLAGQCSPKDIDAITRIIREHNQRHRAAECTMAVRIHQDADILDHFGAQCIWLAFHWNALHDETPQQSLEYYHSNRNKEWLAAAQESLNFEVSQSILDEKITFERDFYDRFAQEMDGVF
ncbi:MAG: HD domain-containing protein [Phycisphaerae bacterium]|nr:HD domain-containing protein [Phycisphaerae bacterium]